VRFVARREGASEQTITTRESPAGIGELVVIRLLSDVQIAECKGHNLLRGHGTSCLPGLLIGFLAQGLANGVYDRQDVLLVGRLQVDARDFPVCVSGVEQASGL